MCLACPRGTDCSRYGCSLNALPLRKGFYRFKLDSSAVHRCPYRKTCSGGNKTGDQMCSMGAEGPLCGICSKKYTRGPGGVCVACNFRNTISAPLVIFSLFLILCILIYLKVDIVVRTCLPMAWEQIADLLEENEHFVAVVLEKLSLVAVTVQTILLVAWNQKLVDITNNGA